MFRTRTRALVAVALLLGAVAGTAPAPALAGPARPRGAVRRVPPGTGDRPALVDPRQIPAAWRADRRRLARAPRPTPRGRLLTTSLASGSARLDLVRGARSDVFMSTFIFRDDLAGRAILSELIAAARAGRRVRLLIDALRNELPPEALAHLLEAGVEVALYNPPSIAHPLRATHRLHDKILVVDGAHLVLGGRNASDGYFGLRRTKVTQYVDVDLYANGEVAAEAARYGAELWDSALVVKLRRGDLAVRARRVERYAAELARRPSSSRALTHLRTAWRQRPEAPLTGVEFVHSGTGSLRNVGAPVQARLIRLIDEAASEVEIMNSYLVPTPELLAAIARARERGVTVRVMTNSARSTADRIPQLAYEAQLDRIARSGVEVWELQESVMLHAKTVVVDRRRVFVSTFNLDPRSRDLNKEVGVVADSAELAEDLLRRGRTLRAASSLAIAGGEVTEAKKRAMGWFDRVVVKPAIGWLFRATGIYGQL